METFKQVMAFPMFAAAIFFLSAFGNVTGSSGVTWLLVGLLIIAMGLWVYGRWCTPMQKKPTRMKGMVAALMILLLGLFVSHSATKNRAKHGGPSEVGGLVWEEWSEGRVRDLRAEGKMVFVDFTASW
mgnify:CR=1 FL=1